MNDLQAIQLDILKEFVRVMERQAFTFFAMFGTLLGAARHGGIIPWDRDIDVAMPREDYDRLRARPELFQAPYFLQTTTNDPAAIPRFIRLMREDTAHIGDFPNIFTRGGHMGIYIDIIPLDVIPDIVAARRVQSATHVIHQQMLGCAAFDETGHDDIPSFKEEYCYSYAGLPGYYTFFAEYYEKTCSSFPGGNYYAMPVLHGERGWRLYDREWFRECVYMDFEDMKIPAPVGWRETLAVSYPEGFHERQLKYRPIEQLNIPIIDTKRSYKEYTRRYTDALMGIGNKKIFFFGAGDSLRIWLSRYGEGLNIICTFDNAASKWGGTAYGVPIRSPRELPNLLGPDSRLIITSIYHKEIAEQLDAMGITEYFIFIDGWNYRSN